MISFPAQDKSHLPAGHPDVAFGRVGVLLVNLGTPDATDYKSMRRYLKEFLSDRRVIETPRYIWWPILNFVVLTKRPKSSGEAYDLIWNRELDESPLRTITRSQGQLLAERLKPLGPKVVVDWAMRYGNPSIKEGLDRLTEQGCERIVIFPLYPQYAAATTATVNDKAFEALMQMRRQPAVRTVPPYHDDPVYIDALAKSVKKELAKLDFEPEKIIASFHGLPQEYFDKGDPYHCHCAKTTRLLREALGVDKDYLQMTFQSRFGKAEWIKPYTDETIKQLARDGVKRIAVLTPGFVADCVETLEEIAGQNKEFFEEEGGEHFAALPCLNDSEEGMDVIEHVVRRELAGWV
ncbi:Ferrochelatase, protoheme ferro-lyase [Lutibaculum baratangense AMV1]|uniref:Ferrochelatase n=1 Tax=Lutibaculum baratangense AMV1 TaxID=631454 RepID=V4RTQ0_9HYPH|nr:Ferrochelatase, protoheme ferro-lyase [Lutibaculum baratangense AMV1]